MKNKKLWITIAFLAIAALLIVFFLPRENEPSPETRVILEHTYRTYIAPSCFETAEATNFLEEATLGYAEELNYPPHSECTESAFAGNNDSPFVSLLKELGIKEDDTADW